jgi:predicted nuclease of predicted toxin-antitoxin system
MAKLYADENFNLKSVALLKELGHDVLTPHDTGQANQRVPDETVMEFAQRTERIVLTFDRKDYARLHLLQPGHFGIMICKQDIDFIALANRIHAALEAASGQLSGQLVRINRPNPSSKS